MKAEHIKDVEETGKRAAKAIVAPKREGEMTKTWQERRLDCFYKQFKLRTPKRWKECACCHDYFKDEPMYRRTVRIYSGPYWKWYCVDCYLIVERRELREVGVIEEDQP